MLWFEKPIDNEHRLYDDYQGMYTYVQWYKGTVLPIHDHDFEQTLIQKEFQIALLFMFNTAPSPLGANDIERSNASPAIRAAMLIGLIRQYAASNQQEQQKTRHLQQQFQDTLYSMTVEERRVFRWLVNYGLLDEEPKEEYAYRALYDNTQTLDTAYTFFEHDAEFEIWTQLGILKTIHSNMPLREIQQNAMRIHELSKTLAPPQLEIAYP